MKGAAVFKTAPFDRSGTPPRSRGKCCALSAERVCRFASLASQSNYPRRPSRISLGAAERLRLGKDALLGGGLHVRLSLRRRQARQRLLRAHHVALTVNSSFLVRLACEALALRAGGGIHELLRAPPTREATAQRMGRFRNAKKLV